MFEWLRAKGSAVWPLMVRILYGQTAAAPRDAPAYLKLYQEDPWIYAPVWYLASAVASTPRIMKKGEEIITEHPLLDLLNAPNSDQSGYDLLEATTVYLELVGEGYWEKVKNKVDKPGELYTLRPDRIEIVPDDAKKRVAAYTYTVSGIDAVTFPPEDIVPFLYFNPVDDWRGQGSVKCLEETIEDSRYSRGWRRRFLRRFGAKEGYLSTEQSPGGPIVQRLKEKWSERFKPESDETPVLPRGLKYQPVSGLPKESGLMDFLKSFREAKLAATGVPPVKVGLLEYAKYSNYDLQSRAFAQDSLAPRLLKIAGAINRCLLPDFEKPSSGLRFEFGALQKTYTSLDELVGLLAELFDRGGLSPNDLIRITGFGKAFEGGDKHYLQERTHEVEGTEAEGAEDEGTEAEGAAEEVSEAGPDS